MGSIVFMAGCASVIWLEMSAPFNHETPHKRLVAGLIVGVPFLIAALIVQARKRSAAAKAAAPAPRTSYTFGQQGRRN